MYFWLKFCTQGFLIIFVYLQESRWENQKATNSAYFNVSQMLLSLYLGSSLGSICLNLIQADLRRGMLIYVLFQVSPFHDISRDLHAGWLPTFVNTDCSLSGEGVHLAVYLESQDHRPKHRPKRLHPKHWAHCLLSTFGKRIGTTCDMLNIMALKNSCRHTQTKDGDDYRCLNWSTEAAV